MPKTHKPRAGSLQYWPRKRAKRIYPRVRSWNNIKEKGLLGFAGYKVGMTHVQAYDNFPNSITKGETVSYPVTIIECPPLKPLGIRFYKKTDYGLSVISQITAKNLDKELKRRLKFSKKESKEEIPEKYDEVRLIVYTQPRLTGIGKKKPEIFEIKVKDENFDFKSLLEKEIKAGDVFKNGEYVDVHAVSKGKGFQGPVKRMGISLRHHKSEKGVRRPGSLGAWTPKKVTFHAPQAGQMGYQTRTEYNKHIIQIGNEDINPKSGFNRYGVVKNDYILLKGSIPGHIRRLIILTHGKRAKKQHAVEIKSIIR